MLSLTISSRVVHIQAAVGIVSMALNKIHIQCLPTVKKKKLSRQRYVQNVVGHFKGT